MPDDTQTTIPIINGSGTTVSMLATVNGSSQYVFQSTPRWNGAQVDTTNPLPVQSKGQSVTLVALNVSVVTTGGTAVTALISGNRTAGGWIQNPLTASQNLGINEIGTASGTTSAGSTTFIAPGQTYVLAPSGNPVSVISSDSSHAFSGYGWV
jgi:hypothetical protein